MSNISISNGDTGWTMVKDFDWPDTAPTGFDVELDVDPVFGRVIGYRFVPTRNLDAAAQAFVEGTLAVLQ
ncbi:hypothetical protein G6L37_06225 [Agrobacterium rubi]|nr:hypothetical protein [Agrobacterium rubi]NTF24958.1 hypothetical protein [Agrobacterium rubi]